MELLELMKQRHSVRSYKEQTIEQEKRTVLLAAAEECNRAGNMHIQILFDEPTCFQSFLAHYGRFSGVSAYICMVGPKDADLDEKAGYYGEKLVLKAQEIGLNTCWAALTHGKSKAVVEKGEKEAIVISLGYGQTQGVSHKNKDLSAVCRMPENAPEWFRLGMEAVMTAPTAVNQQKFFFTLEGEEVHASAGKGICSKIDLGIVKYHFEAVTGRKVLG